MYIVAKGDMRLIVRINEQDHMLHWSTDKDSLYRKNSYTIEGRNSDSVHYFSPILLVAMLSIRM